MIGIFGGVFDPIHVGHLRAAIDAVDQYQLEQVRFIPCKTPLDKALPGASIKHRVSMIEAALKPHKQFVLDMIEIRRKTPSYTLFTLKTLSLQYPDKKFGLIIGADRTATLSKWYGYQEICRIAKLITVPRKLPISSSQIKEDLHAGKNCDYLLAPAVLKYIKKHHLYVNSTTREKFHDKYQTN